MISLILLAATGWQDPSSDAQPEGYFRYSCEAPLSPREWDRLIERELEAHQSDERLEPKPFEPRFHLTFAEPDGLLKFQELSGDNITVPAEFDARNVVFTVRGPVWDYRFKFRRSSATYRVTYVQNERTPQGQFPPRQSGPSRCRPHDGAEAAG
ncbi:hypothetical protein [Sphingomicrobium flavum]|uniref:hypothetical protein n=1 Tax=Sphingomicrobium flavum TaxID=1229164 RepID=UPI0021ADA2FE|nr:hypothetical protein [Sphingomicrobium flavum]